MLPRADPRLSPFVAFVTLALSDLCSWETRRAFTEAVARMIEEALLWGCKLNVADGATALASLTLLRAWHLHLDGAVPGATEARFHADSLAWIEAHPTSDDLRELVRYAVEPPSSEVAIEMCAHFLFRWGLAVEMPLAEIMTLLAGMFDGREAAREADRLIEQVTRLDREAAR